MARPVELVCRRTDEDRFAQLMDSDLYAALVCGALYVRNLEFRALFAVPVWHLRLLVAPELVHRNHGLDLRSSVGDESLGVLPGAKVHRIILDLVLNGLAGAGVGFRSVRDITQSPGGLVEAVASSQRGAKIAIRLPLQSKGGLAP